MNLSKHDLKLLRECIIQRRRQYAFSYNLEVIYGVAVMSPEEERQAEKYDELSELLAKLDDRERIIEMHGIAENERE